MKEFFEILGWKNLVIMLLALILIRISIIIPFYFQWYLPPTVDWEYFLMYAFGMIFLLAGNNVLIKFYDEKYKVCPKNSLKTFNIKEYPDIVRLRGMWIVLWFVGAVAIICSFVARKDYNISMFAWLLVVLFAFHYAKTARYQFIIGNVELALINAIIILSIIPQDWNVLIPYSYNYPVVGAVTFNRLLISFGFIAFFMFFLTFIQDINGDLVNIDEDKKRKYSTLAVKLGEKNTKKVLSILALLFIVFTIIFCGFYYNKLGIIQIMITIAIVVLPMIYYIFNLQKSQKQTEYNYLYIFLGMIFISLLFVISFCKYIFINGNI